MMNTKHQALALMMNTEHQALALYIGIDIAHTFKVKSVCFMGKKINKEVNINIYPVQCAAENVVLSINHCISMR